jgi:glycerol-1-phosphate dehydrogenase [NAD(P)+]
MNYYSHLADYLSLDASQLADTSLSCPKCGREHQIPFKIVRSGDNLISNLAETIKLILGKTPDHLGVVYDRHIEEKLDDLFFAPFSTLGLSFSRIPLGNHGELLDAGVEIGDQAAAGMPKEIDFLIGVGSGVISDLTKWIATKCKLSFLLMGTAASMNAYTSITATMTENNVKTSKWLDPASAIFLDSALLASAPLAMTWAGIGDILARNISNVDWKLANILRGTYFCPVPFQMMSSYQEKVMLQAAALGKNNKSAMKDLADAILVSGYSMTVLNGETSPSSGSEHVISHFFDFQHEVFGLPKNLHGTQVGIGTIIMRAAYEILRGFTPADFDIQKIIQNMSSLDSIKADHHRLFGTYGAAFSQVVEAKRISEDEIEPYLRNILENWDEMWGALNPYLLPAGTVRSAMEKAGGVTKLTGIQRTHNDAIQALLYGSHYRSRYTILDLFWELGLFPEVADEILERAGV